MKEVTARLVIAVLLECPHCGRGIDLLAEDDTEGYDHNDDGAVMRQACPDGIWSEEHKSFKVMDVSCTNCGGSFDVKGLEW